MVCRVQAYIYTKRCGPLHRACMAHVNRTLHFVIPICFVPRQSDPFFHILETHSLNSIAQQDYPHWTVALCGDGLNPAEMFRAREMLENRSLIPRTKAFLTNHASNKGERQAYELYARPANRELLWYHGGAACATYCREFIERSPVLNASTHVVEIDDDDIWSIQHLSTLAHVYKAIPSAGFVFTRGKFTDPKVPRNYRYIPPFAAGFWEENVPLASRLELPHVNLSVHFMPPMPCYTLRSATSATRREPLLHMEARKLPDQLLARRNPGKSFKPFGACYSYAQAHHKGYMGGDADYYDRVWDMVLANRTVSALARLVTVIHVSQERKMESLGWFQKMYCARDESSARKAARSMSREWTSMGQYHFREYGKVPTVSTSLGRIVFGRRQRFSQLLWPHGDNHDRQLTEWPGEQQFSRSWSPSQLLSHPDYYASLDTYRILLGLLNLRLRPSEQGEMLHIIRPLLDFACRNNQTCVYAEVGNYCGQTAAFAQTLPQLDLAVTVHRHPITECNASVDPFERQMECFQKRGSTSYRSIPYTAGNGTKRDTSEHLAAKKLATVLNNSEMRGINLLLIGRDDSSRKIASIFANFAPLISVGGVVVLDEYLTSPAVQEFVGPFVQLGPNIKRTGLLGFECRQSWYCVGSVPNAAQALEAGTPNQVSRFSNAFIMTRISDPGDKTNAKTSKNVATAVVPDRERRYFVNSKYDGT